MPNPKKILIIIPAYNEERSVGTLIRELRDRGVTSSIVVVNDGSRDRTAQVAEDAGALVVTNPYNLGIGGTMQAGFQIAREQNFDVAVQLDGDSQHDPASLGDLLEPVLADRLDMVIGSRFLAEQSSFKSTAARRAGIRFFALLLSVFTGIPLTDPTSGYRAIGKKLIGKFAEYYPSDFPEPEAIQIAKRYGARIGEVPVKMRKRLGGISSIGSWKSVYYMIKVTLAIFIDMLKGKR